ncbi:putative metalloprotease CJM1_0395 family protein [Holophaga foetida]|uniref:putative metalloprotease CJM1_0395 family protein n=1 Tax=Holophaga foetida TaxID=35839 RepID=UPI0002471CAF|nr:putative metalloprotease CJM1_0395 family protein [Holophaga foetida]
MDITALDPTRTAPATGTAGVRTQGTPKPNDPSQASSGKGADAGESSDSVELSPEAQAKVIELKARDKAVRAHEAAHLSAAGGLAQGGASFSYAQGPDNKRYAVGGEVSIDTSLPDDPSAAMAKARQIRAAALAPADPSPQDQKVAAQALVMESQAAAKLAQLNRSQSAQGSSPEKPGLDVVA